MSLRDRLRRLLAPSPAAAAQSFRPEVHCRACGEVIPVRIDLANDLSLDDETGHRQVHKVVVGSGRALFSADRGGPGLRYPAAAV